MESYTLPSFPPEYSTIHICLFENVRNSPEIKKRLITAATTKGEEGDKLRAEVDFGFLEGDVLVSKEHLLTSILTTLLYSFPSTSNSAGVDIPNIEPLSISSSSTPSSSASTSTSTPTPSSILAEGGTPSSKPKPKTRTHNLHSELLLSLSPNNNITDSIRRHGISDTTTNLVVVKFTGPHTNQESVYQSIADVVQGNLVGWDQIQKKTDWGRVDKIYKLSELNSLKSSTTPDEILNKKISAVVSAVGIKNVI